MISRRLMLAQIFLILAGCSSGNSNPNKSIKNLIFGLISYGENYRTNQKYARLINYLDSQTNTLIELEPAYNEVKAIEQIERQVWDIVFASSGLAAIAIKKYQYLPLFQLEGVARNKPIIVVLEESRIKKLNDLRGKKIALGQAGSATGYYVPLNELQGITLNEIILAPTPQTILELMAKGKVDAGALSKEELDRYRSQFEPAKFRIVHTSPIIPPGAVVISPKIDRTLQEILKKAMNNVPPDLAQEAGYIPNTEPPNYDNLNALIEQVKPLESKIEEKPVRL